MDELDRIAAEGRTLDQDGNVLNDGGAGPTPPPASGTGDQESIAMWAMIPSTFGNILCLALPELKPVYEKPNCLAWGAAMNDYAKAKGWDVSKNAPLLGVLIASSMFVIPTVGAIVARRRAAKANQPGKDEKPDDGGAPGTGGFTSGGINDGTTPPGS